jgi:hypothetical protein
MRIAAPAVVARHGGLVDKRSNSSAQIRATQKRKKRGYKGIQGILIYVVFITIYVASTSDHFGHTIFFFANSLKSQFTGVEMKEQFSPTFGKVFSDISTVEEYYHWLQSGFFHAAFSPNTFDGGDRLAGMKAGYTLGPNKILGAIRVSQARSERMVCSETPGELVGVSGSDPLHCWEGGEPVDNFGNFSWGNRTYQFIRSGIKLHPVYDIYLPADSVAKERATIFSDYYGKQLEKIYDAPAWAVLLDPKAPIAVNEAAILALVNGKYIDLQTTAVFVDLTVYNPNLDFVCVIRLVAELPSSGGVYTSSDFHVVRVYNQHTAEDEKMYILNIVVGCFYGYYFLNECNQLRKVGCVFLLHPANYTIVVNVFLYVYGLYYSYQVRVISPETQGALNGSDFFNYWPAAQCARFVIQLASANCFLNFIQGVVHLAYVPTFALLGDTIKLAAPDLTSFLFVFALVFYGFAQAHTMVFRDRLQGYRSLKHSAYSLMSALLGDFNFNELNEADHMLGPFFFVFFIGLTVFIVLNMVSATPTHERDSTLMHQHPHTPPSHAPPSHTTLPHCR